MQSLWYVAYGTNLSSARFAVYLRGGRPVGGARYYHGSRDPLAPQRDFALRIPGGIRFVGTSSVWGGGLAVYDKSAEGEVAARAYLITAEQFVDVLAQEARLPSGADLDLAPVLQSSWHSFGTGCYQTVAALGTHEGLPMLTFTAADVHARPVNAPSSGYLWTMALGLRESHGWDGASIGRYLASHPGVARTWTSEMLENIAAEDATHAEFLDGQVSRL